MIKKLICIECPKGCALSVAITHSRVIKVSGNACPKGKVYAVSEIEAPVRIVTTTVPAEGLSLKMVPVKTDRPIPKDRILKVMGEIRKIKITQPVCAGDVVARDLLHLKVNLVATREVFR
jgi:CxxC motif-containing protein